MKNELLQVKNLSADFRSYEGTAYVLDGVSFSVDTGEILGIVGETGCGKSVTGLSILRLLPRNGSITAGEISLGGERLLDKSKREMVNIRGNKISMIFQHPQSSLNPVMRIGKQLTAIIKNKMNVSRADADELAVQFFERVGLPDPKYLLSKYPHELSGGMQQRVMIAAALSCSPDLLIADEPTTALDVTIQSQILKLIKKLRDDRGMGIMLITHSMGVVAQTCSKIAVMYAGQVVESGDVGSVFSNPMHPYTVGLMRAIPAYRQNARLSSIPGAVCNLREPPAGCRFHPRCSAGMEICRLARPGETNLSSGHKVSCHLCSGEGQ